jgi:putative FmdB family regulatory protein
MIREGGAMPTYEYQCDACKKIFSVVRTIAEHSRGGVACPKCKKKNEVRQLVSTFIAQTSKKS